MKTIWVEILVISAIVLIPLSYALRIIYGDQWLKWENGLVESLGINSVVYLLAKIAILIGVLGYLLMRQKRKQKKDDSKFYQLPKS